MTSTVLRSTDNVFCRISLNLNLHDVFIMIITVMGVGEDDHRGHVIFITSRQRYRLSMCFVTVDADLHHLAEAEFVRLLPCKAVLFFPFSVVFYLKVTMHSPHLRDEELSSPPFGWTVCINHLKFFTKICPFSLIY